MRIFAIDVCGILIHNEFSVFIAWTGCYLFFLIVDFPRVGQNIQIDREEGKRLNVTQSIYRTAFKWFNEYEKTDKMGIQRYYIPRSIRYE